MQARAALDTAELNLDRSTVRTPDAGLVTDELNLGAAYTIGKVLRASDLKFGLKDKAGVSTTPEISVGSEFHQFSFMPLRAGVSFGGVHGTSLGLGGGFRLSSFFIDLAWASSGTLLPSFGRGLSLAVSSGLRF